MVLAFLFEPGWSLGTSFIHRIVIDFGDFSENQREAGASFLADRGTQSARRRFSSAIKKTCEGPPGRWVGVAWAKFTRFRRHRVVGFHFNRIEHAS